MVTIPNPEIEIRYYCPNCGQPFSSEEDYKDHYIKNHIPMDMPSMYGKFYTGEYSKDNAGRICTIYYVAGPSETPHCLHVVSFYSRATSVGPLEDTPNLEYDKSVLKEEMPEKEAKLTINYWMNEYYKEVKSDVAHATRIASEVLKNE